MSELHIQDWIPAVRPCPAVKGYYCVFCALACFLHLASEGLFSFCSRAAVLCLLHDVFIVGVSGGEYGTQNKFVHVSFGTSALRLSDVPLRCGLCQEASTQSGFSEPDVGLHDPKHQFSPETTRSSPQSEPELSLKLPG